MDILIATGIVATLMVIGVPRLVAMRAPVAVNGAARQIAADVQTARMRAIARNARYRVTFTPSTKSYVLERETAPNSNVFVADGGVQKLPKAVSITAPAPASPLFSTTGLLATQISLEVSAPGAHTKTVTINVLGRTTVS